jgi:hypothetical protein
MPTVIPSRGSDPIPAQDAALASFAAIFAAAWVPATFNVVAPLAATVTAASGAFSTALDVATDPATRTTPAIASKTAARVALVALLRTCIRAAQAAYLAGTASESQLNDLGVRANSLIRSPIPAPTFGPILAVDQVSPGVVTLRVTQVDQSTGLAVTTRGYSIGIVGVEIQRKVGSGAFVPVGLRKTVRINDSTEALASGSLLVYRARYSTLRGLVSPWSPEVNGTVLS